MTHKEFKRRGIAVTLNTPLPEGRKTRDGMQYPKAALVAIGMFLDQVERNGHIQFLVRASGKPKAAKSSIPGGDWRVREAYTKSEYPGKLYVTCAHKRGSPERRFIVELLGSSREKQFEFVRAAILTHKLNTPAPPQRATQVPTGLPQLQSTFRQLFQKRAGDTFTWIPESDVLKLMERALEQHRIAVPSPLGWKECRSFLEELKEQGHLEIQGSLDGCIFRLRATRLPKHLASSDAARLHEVGDLTVIVGRLIKAEVKRRETLEQLQALKREQEERRAQIAELEQQLSKLKIALQDGSQERRALEAKLPADDPPEHIVALQRLVRALDGDENN